VIAEEDNDRIRAQPFLIKLSQNGTHLIIERRHQIVVVGEITPRLRRVGMIRRQQHLRGIMQLGGFEFREIPFALGGRRADLALMRHGKIHVGEEWLARESVAPVGR
jgi:hypothetical protein